ncbi:cupin domain-containing protein [Hyphomicrobium sp. CS1BSMeth3]|uniref:cupin domain-containing protein n=1 Tax=Hyphomicrobium sp. CS1BSMeth3 TaxID=1892844 RepID=UPI0009318414|nr:cupin domain-containing protein [Hyphomicrobium sp. CS1BSMeth3]
MLRSTFAICAALSVLAWTNPVAAQQSLPAAANQTQGIKRIPLQRFDVPGTAYETVIGIAEIAPNVSIGRHTHPGPESGYLIEGGFELLIDGEAPRMLKAGESYKVPPRTVHDAKTGPEGAKVLATYVVEKGQPIASPAK